MHAPNRQHPSSRHESQAPRFRTRLPDCPAPPQAPCKICQTPAPFVGALDFNKACLGPQVVKQPTYGYAVYYRRCPACHFLFSDFFDDWSPADFKTHIYNADYAALDPDYETVRPDGNAALLAGLFRNKTPGLSVLDYGGGNGRLAERLRAAGFAACDTYDPFTPAFAKLPTRRYDVVTCFETLEHTPDPAGCVRAIAARLADAGTVVFSTLVQPADFDQIGLSWWYVGPRNGHISIHSGGSLALLWQTHGFALKSLNDNLHIACRGVAGSGAGT